MYAIVQVAGVQVRVAPGERVYLPRLEAQEGSTITINEVLLLADGEQVTVGTPVVEGARVEAEVIAHDRDKKVLVFKKKRRKRYRRLRGHRQPYTEVQVTEIVAPREAAKEA